MNRPADAIDADRTDNAFNRVLAAEAQARERVAACRQEAAALICAAEERARSIAQRTDGRVRRAHDIADAAMARTLGAPDTSPAHIPEDLPPAPPPAETDALIPIALLDQALDTLINEVLAAPQGPTR